MMVHFQSKYASAVVMAALLMDVAIAFGPNSAALLPSASSRSRFGPLSSATARRGDVATIVMAAKGKSGGKKGVAPAFKGFGSLPDVLQDRMPDPSEECACW